ncbi:uncharacterized protein FTOL_13360 [Fusarium torulosum]|uniref:Uncharacterized protein n=1 Tax=Fusarium torulosum TaxID=33205 RepID=A0AAE8MME0_9HYPO|nr:uncharacterized protein FTOL_13360 [Fusarium torulosum]
MLSLDNQSRRQGRSESPPQCNKGWRTGLIWNWTTESERRRADMEGPDDWAKDD